MEEISNSTVELCDSNSAPARIDCYADLSASITSWEFSLSEEAVDPDDQEDEDDDADLFDEDEEYSVGSTSSGTLTVISRVSKYTVIQVAALQELLANGDGESFTVFCHYNDAEGLPVITSMFVCDSIEWGSLYGDSKKYAHPLELALHMNVLHYDLMKPSEEFPAAKLHELEAPAQESTPDLEAE
jgi:hypothetical protein